MLDKPPIAQTAAQTTAIIRLAIPREAMQTAMGPGRGELMAAIAAPISSAGRVTAGHLPAATVARTVYHRPLIR